MEDTMCQWPVDLSCLPDGLPDDDGEKLRQAVDTAVSVLWAYTGRQFGLCTAEVEVTRNECVPCEPTLFAGRWYNIDPTAGGCVKVSLPPPVWEVLEVQAPGGEPLPFTATAYGVQVLGNPVLVRYVRGRPTPPGAGAMVGRLASQLYLQCIGDKRCELPRNVSSVSRNNVQVQFNPPEPGFTGLPDVDTWVRAHNPHGLAEPSAVIL